MEYDMPNYEQLINRLRSDDSTFKTLEIEEIEEIIGGRLPTLFLKYNDEADFQNYLIDRGFILVKIDTLSRKVTFKTMSLLQQFSVKKGDK